MAWLFYVERVYSVFQRGAILKGVVCESCGMNYVYKLTVDSQGIGKSAYFLDNKGAQRRARAEAQRILEKQFATECEAAPCPRCGRIQRHMFKTARSPRWGKYSRTGCSTFWIAVLFGGGPFGLSCAGLPIPGAILAILAVVSLSLAAVACLQALGAWIHWRCWDPNSQPLEERLALAAKMCMTKEEFLLNHASAGTEMEQRKEDIQD
jgi:hypothetical protein